MWLKLDRANEFWRCHFLGDMKNLFKAYETKEELSKKLTDLVLSLDFGDSFYFLIDL